MYREEIEKVWDLEDRSKNKSVIISEQYDSIPDKNWISLNGDVKFNEDTSKCHLYDITQEKTILESLKNCKSCVAIGLNNKSHIISSARRFNVFFLNAICVDTLVETDVYFKELGTKEEDKYICHSNPTKKPSTDGKSIKEKLNESKSHDSITESSSLHSPTVLEMSPENKEEKQNLKRESKTANNLMNIDWGDGTIDSSNKDETKEIEHIYINNPTKDLFPEEGRTFVENDKLDDFEEKDKLKKANRLKLIIAIVIALMVILIVLGKYCKTEQTNSKPSISGETIQMKN